MHVNYFCFSYCFQYLDVSVMFNTHNFFTTGDLCKSVTSNRQDRILKHKPSGRELCKSLSLQESGFWMAYWEDKISDLLISSLMSYIYITNLKEW